MRPNIFLLLLAFAISDSLDCVRLTRRTRHIGVGNGPRGISSPPLGDEIDLETIEGVEQVTKLVLIKTDSLPGESDDRIDGRYLNSLMETLYTGLRKPFKSVSADILGIFPSFEEIQVRCERPNRNENLEKDESINVKRSTSYFMDIKVDRNISTKEESVDQGEEGLKTEERRNETNIETDSSYLSQTPYKSSLQVCQAVTSDCLSMDDLVQILPPTIDSFDKALVRLCPIMLFRIMNHLCRKSTSNRHQEELASSDEKVREEVDGIGSSVKKDSITLNTLLRETQILKNLQNSDDLASKRPQKLHKKLKTQTPYKSNARLNAATLQQHGSVDEQLLKIRLKLTEPSIEKVWIFSLLFVILSIVVSMGGLIVLPFVKKTTRRRILTLFEGLAVGGLAGSATLHMFPQAFGLVDENYHKYFWRIFVVFLGIYLCYLCERMIKILKVMRARIRRRSRASLIDMDYRYGFPLMNRDASWSRSKSTRALSPDFDYDLTDQSYALRKKDSRKTNSQEIDFHETCKECIENKYLERKKSRVYMGEGKGSLEASINQGRTQRYHERGSSKKGSNRNKDLFNNFQPTDQDDAMSANNLTDVDSVLLEDGRLTRQRLVQCLKSVQRQFSPVHAVQTQNLEGTNLAQDESRVGKLTKLANYREKNRESKKGDKPNNSKKSKVLDSRYVFGKKEKKPSMKKYLKQRDLETMLYHQRMMGRHGRGEASLDQGYLQQRLSSLNDVRAERQDQDNAAKMSVDTVAWMIVFGDAVLNVIDGLSIGAAFERNILAGISISVAVMLEEVTHRLGTFAVLIRAGMSMQQSLLCTFLSACALFPGLIVGILLSDATEDATPYIFCAAGGIFLYMALVDVMKEMNRSIENAIRKDIKSTLQIFALQNVGIIVAVIFLSFLALYEQAMDFEEYQIQYNQPS